MKEEKYIKDTLLDYDSPMEMDAIWSELDAALDKAEAIATPVTEVTTSTSYKKYLPLLLFLLVSGCGFYAYKNLSFFSGAQISTEVMPSQKQKNKPSTQQSTKAEAIPAHESAEPNTTTDKNDVKQRGIDSKKKPTTKKAAATQQKMVSKPSSSKALNLVKATGGNKSLTPPPTASNNNKASEGQVSQNVVAQVPTQKVDKVIVAQPIAKRGLDGLKGLMTEIALIDFTRDLDLDFHLAKVESANAIVPRKKGSWRLGAHSGFASSFNDVTLNGQSLNTPINALADLEPVLLQRLSKPTFGIQLEKILPSGIKVATGLNLLNQGHIVATIDTLGKTETELFREVSEPMEDEFGRTVVTTSVTTLLETTLSKEISEVDIKMIQVPLSIGYQKEFSQIDLSISGGLGINLVTDQQSPPSLLDINPLKIPTVSLSGLADIQLGYTFEDRFRIYGSAFGGRHLSTNMINTEAFDLENTFDVKSKLNHYGLRAGISFML